jgi:hypothetical protein
VAGGFPWQAAQPVIVAVQLTVTDPAPPAKLPWQYTELHDADVALARAYVPVLPPIAASVTSAMPFPST